MVPTPRPSADLRPSLGRLALAVLALLALTSPAHANSFVPSFVQLLTGPLLWSIFQITLIVTVPILVGISSLEAAVLRRVGSVMPFRRLMWRLFWVNACTSLVGTVLMYNGTELWPGLPSAFVLTSVLEAIPLRRFEFGLPRPAPLRRFLFASAKMNGASYAAMGIVLAAMIHLPALGQEDRTLLKEVRGALVAADRFDSPLQYWVVPLGVPGSGRLPPPKDLIVHRKVQFRQASGDRMLAFNSSGPIGSLQLREGRLVWQRLPAAGLAGVCEVSRDGTQACIWGEGRLEVRDVKSHDLLFQMKAEKPMQVRLSADGQFLCYQPEDAEASLLVDVRTGYRRQLGMSGHHAATFSPARSELAWIVDDCRIATYNCMTGARRLLTVPGRISGFTSLSWSPDGAFLAYLGHANHFTDQQRFGPLGYGDLRIVRSDGHGSATVAGELPQCTDLFWLPGGDETSSVQATK